jgi:hypothetical protein
MNKNELEESINEIVTTIGTLTFNLDFSPAPSPLCYEMPESPTYRSTVHILGDWNGSATVSMSRELAEQATMHLLSIADESDVTLYHVQQFMQEFVNMTGGNLKPMLGERCALSVPKCYESKGFFYTTPESNLIINSAFKCSRGGFMNVAIFESIPDLKQSVAEITNDKS